VVMQSLSHRISLTVICHPRLRGVPNI
jgi:hypothetical protein